MFREPGTAAAERRFPVAAIVIAAVVVVLAVSVYAALSRRQAVATGTSRTRGQTAA